MINNHQTITLYDAVFVQHSGPNTPFMVHSRHLSFDMHSSMVNGDMPPLLPPPMPPPPGLIVVVVVFLGSRYSSGSSGHGPTPMPPPPGGLLKQIMPSVILQRMSRGMLMRSPRNRCPPLVFVGSNLGKSRVSYPPLFLVSLK